MSTTQHNSAPTLHDTTLLKPCCPALAQAAQLHLKNRCGFRRIGGRVKASSNARISVTQVRDEMCIWCAMHGRYFRICMYTDFEFILYLHYYQPFVSEHAQPLHHESTRTYRATPLTAGRCIGEGQSLERRRLPCHVHLLLRPGAGIGAVFTGTCGFTWRQRSRKRLN